MDTFTSAWHSTSIRQCQCSCDPAWWGSGWICALCGGACIHCPREWLRDGWTCKACLQNSKDSCSRRKRQRTTCEGREQRNEPDDLHIGCTIRLGPVARMWTGKINDPASQLYRSRNLAGIELTVLDIHRVHNYTQIQAKCDITSFPVWVNVWHRFDEHGRPCGVRWATVIR